MRNMTEQELEALSIDELEQLGFELGRQKDAIRDQMIAAKRVLSRKLNIERLYAKLNAEERALLAGIVPVDAVAKPEAIAVPIELKSVIAGGE